MSIEKRLTVVARYNEDISWTESLPGDVIIYNKGKDFTWDFPRIDVMNFGREAETYVRAILDFYHKLPDYDSVVFLQGDPFVHSKKLLEKLNNNTTYPFSYLGDFAQYIESGSGECIYGSSLQIVDLYWKDIIKNTPVLSEKENFRSQNLTQMEYNIKLADGTIENRLSELMEVFYLCEIMKIPYRDTKYNWDCGAQYCVKVENILNKSAYWWNSLHNLMHYTSVVLNSNIIAYILERTWPLIWNHDERRSITGHFYGENPKI